ncbi:MAG: hypothetical protein P9X24_13465 [Candidatus Hatepunaea meridiana]|nr:hypothetical protein [Candidatus Hatepunaea meridiana]
MKHLRMLILLTVFISIVLSIGILGCSGSTTPYDPNNDPNQSPPLPPSSLSAVAVSLTEIRLTWRDRSSNESGFELFESVDSDTNFSLIQRTNQNVEIYVFNGKSRDHDYYYKIRAINEFGASRFTDQVTVTGGALILTIDSGDSPVLSLAYSPQGNYIIAGCGDYRVRRYDARSGEMLQKLEGHTNLVYGIAYSPDSTRWASGSDDETIMVWSMLNHRLEWTLYDDDMGAVRSMEFSYDGRYLAALSGYVYIWDMETGDLAYKIGDEESGGVGSFAYHPDGRHMILSLDNKIQIWEPGIVDSALLGRRSIYHMGRFTISPDGEYLAGVSNSNIVVMQIINNNGELDIDTTAVVASLTESDGGHTDAIYALDFSPDGLYLASGSRDDNVKVWDAVNFTLLATMDAHDVAVYCLAFSSSGVHLATGGGDTNIKIWSTFF